jgi:hypothetical protein
MNERTDAHDTTPTHSSLKLDSESHIDNLMLFRHSQRRRCCSRIPTITANQASRRLPLPLP